MKKIFKIITFLVLLLIIVIGSGMVYVKTQLPDVGPAPDLNVEVTSERVERGSYLAHHVSLCMDCHASRDWTQFSGPPVDGTLGIGGEIFDQKFGFPGKFTSKNITPFALASWTDGEIYRAITCGVNKDNVPLFPVMPWKFYAQMDPEDIYSIIAYLRTIPSIESHPEPSEADFPMSFIQHLLPEKIEQGKRPIQADTKEYGKYMATSAGCMECHTNQDKGEYIGPFFAGGFRFNLGNGTFVVSPNITPDPTGIGNWTQEQFIRRFKMYQDSGYVLPAVHMDKGEFQTVMPWSMYSGMEEKDLAAIYTYLRTVTAVENSVVRFESN